MKKIKIFFILISLIFVCSGCNTDDYLICKKFLSTSRPSIYEQAGFYESNYPECTANEKVDIFKDSLINQKQDFEIITKKYVIKRKYIYVNGRIIFPKIEDIEKDSEYIGDTVEIFGRKF